MAFGRWKERCLHKTIKGGDVTSFTDTNLKEGTTYIYWIKSYRMDYQNKKYIAGAMIIPKVLCISEK